MTRLFNSTTAFVVIEGKDLRLTSEKPPTISHCRRIRIVVLYFERSRIALLVGAAFLQRFANLSFIYVVACDVRAFGKPISVKSFTPIVDLPSCVVEFEAKKAISVPVSASGSSLTSAYRSRNKTMRPTLHPDDIRAEHTSDFEGDVSALQTMKILGSRVSGTGKLMTGQGSKKFAAKCCSPSCGSRIFRREFDVMCRLTDPCVVPFHGYSVTSQDFGESSAALVMRYMEHPATHQTLRMAEESR
jgi:hypothetical protein